MERPSEFWQLIQAYVVIAVGVLALIVMADAKTRRDQETRMSLILGHSGKFPNIFSSYRPRTRGVKKTCGSAGQSSITEGYGTYDDTECYGKDQGPRIRCNLSEGNNLNYYEGYGERRYLDVGGKDDMDNYTN